MSKILVTAASGTVSSVLINTLKETNQDFRIALRNLEKANELGWNGLDTVVLDFEKPETHSIALEGIEKIFTLLPNYTENFLQNFKLFLDTAKSKGAKHIVFMTAMGVEHNEEAPLRQMEKYIEQSGFTYTFLRPNWFMQNFVKFHGAAIKNLGGIYLPAGNAKTSFIDTRDISECAYEALLDDRHINKSYTLTGPEPLSHFDVAKKISDALGKDVQYHALTDDEARDLFTKIGYTNEMTEMMIGLYNFVKQGYSEIVTDDVKLILGREPINFDKFVQDYLEFWQ